ncbi:ester cyclase [Hyalangium gracile]|uniref:ester cyclase n=1 Tax=Hyalangium gracile TaxID=394092 RepID=UPI001CCB3B7D|nr:ester cyclase [Hyalangium gracile]
MPLPDDLRARREAILREHFDSENRHDFEATMTTFRHPRYELMATGDVYEGAEAVRRYYKESRTAFPDQRNRLLTMHHADDAIITEFELYGTHLGNYRGLPPTGRAFKARMSAIFLFEGELITCERIYFDANTILRQLGIAHDPLTLKGRLATALNHPVTVGKAFLRQALHRARAVSPASRERDARHGSDRP